MRHVAKTSCTVASCALDILLYGITTLGSDRTGARPRSVSVRRNGSWHSVTTRCVMGSE